MSSAGLRFTASPSPAGRPHAPAPCGHRGRARDTLQPRGGDTPSRGGVWGSGIFCGLEDVTPSGPAASGKATDWQTSVTLSRRSRRLLPLGTPWPPNPPPNRSSAGGGNRGTAGPQHPHRAEQAVGKPRHRVGTVVDLGSDTRVREELRAEPVVPARVSRSGDAVGAGPGAGHAEPGTTLGGSDAETRSVLTGEGTGVSLVSPPIHPRRLHPS